MLYTLSVLVDDKPGVLDRVAAVFRRRKFNIESLTVGHTDHVGLSRMTIVVDGEEQDVERITHYLYKLVNVIFVENLTVRPMVSRDLAMVKVNASPEKRAEILNMVNVFRAHVVDITPTAMIAEITGDSEKIESFVEVLKPMGIIEMVRTGAVAMARGDEPMFTNGNGHKN
ncbi:MAG: acetolactate synthase small subunit [Anaerolineales bacterium]|nr:acetolactate synthase small subunit [Anaerolineales bacterium]